MLHPGQRVRIKGTNDCGTVREVKNQSENSVPLVVVDMDPGTGYYQDFCVARESELEPEFKPNGEN